MAHFVVPLTFAIVVCRYFGLFKTRCVAPILGTMWPSAVAGYLSKGLLPAVYNLPPRGLDRSAAVLQALAGSFGRGILSGNPQYLYCSACLAAAAGTALWLLRRHVLPERGARVLDPLQQRAVLFLVFIALSAGFSILAAIVAGVDARDEQLARRFCLPFYVSPLFASAIVIGIWVPTARGRRRWVVAIERLAMVAVVAAPAYLLVASPKQSHPLHARTSPFPLVRAMDERAREFGLKYGVGGYWEARRLTLLSSTGLHVYPVFADLSPFTILANRYWYCGHPASRHPHPEYSFVLLNGAIYGVARQTVVAKFGEPAEEFAAGQTDVLVYNRRSDWKFRELFR